MGAFERLFLLMGIGLTVALSTVSLRAVLAARAAQRFEDGTQAAKSADDRERLATKDGEIVPEGSFAGTYLNRESDDNGPTRVIGQLRMPALAIAVPIISGIADRDLARGVGHIPGSGNAGGLGNMAVAGHRDTFFRPLRGVTPGMIAVVSSASGSYRYLVDKTEVVTPQQLRILEVGDRPQLTMITCYPFNYIGAAPQRFVVFAHLVSAAPDTQNR